MTLTSTPRCAPAVNGPPRVLVERVERVEATMVPSGRRVASRRGPTHRARSRRRRGSKARAQTRPSTPVDVARGPWPVAARSAKEPRGHWQALDLKVIQSFTVAPTPALHAGRTRLRAGYPATAGAPAELAATSVPSGRTDRRSWVHAWLCGAHGRRPGPSSRANCQPCPRPGPVDSDRGVSALAPEVVGSGF